MTNSVSTKEDRQTDGHAENNRALPKFVGEDLKRVLFIFLIHVR